MAFSDELLKNLKVEMKHKTRKRNHTFELIHSDLERRKAMIHNLCFYWFAFLCFLCTPSNDRTNHLGKGAKDRSKWTQGVAKQVFWKVIAENKHRNNKYKWTAKYETMFWEEDMFDRELFVDSTRSVSVVLGEKDNKSVNQNILKSAIHAKHFW